jgi:hypothetical protein
VDHCGGTLAFVASQFCCPPTHQHTPGAQEPAQELIHLLPQLLLQVAPLQEVAQVQLHSHNTAAALRRYGAAARCACATEDLASPKPAQLLQAPPHPLIVVHLVVVSRLLPLKGRLEAEFAQLSHGVHKRRRRRKGTGGLLLSCPAIPVEPATAVRRHPFNMRLRVLHRHSPQGWRGGTKRNSNPGCTGATQVRSTRGREGLLCGCLELGTLTPETVPTLLSLTRCPALPCCVL